MYHVTIFKPGRRVFPTVISAISNIGIFQLVTYNFWGFFKSRSSNHQEYYFIWISHSMCSRLVFRRHFLSVQGRAYSTTTRVPLAYNLHNPPKESDLQNAPIIFMHGLFGSKKNNRSISKWAVLVSIDSDPVLTVNQSTSERPGETCLCSGECLFGYEVIGSFYLLLNRIFEIMGTHHTIPGTIIWLWRMMWKGSWRSISSVIQRWSATPCKSLW